MCQIWHIGQVKVITDFVPFSTDFVPNNYYNVVSYVHIPLVPCRSEAKRSDVPYGHASMLLLSEGSEATEPYNKYANLF